MILDVKNARGVVRPLGKHAQPREPVGIVAQHGAVGRAVKSQRALLHPAEKVSELLARCGPAPSFCSSSHVPLIASHISMVSAVRTERAFERATSKHERMEEGLSGEKARNSVTVCSFASLCAEKKPAA